MNPGDLRDRIEVYAVVRSDDEIGGTVETETLKGAIWARVRTPTVRNSVLAMQGAEIRTHEVTCRAGDQTPISGDIIHWAGTRLFVRGTRPDIKNRLVVADCVDDRP